jgi:hypothetical protein
MIMDTLVLDEVRGTHTSEANQDSRVKRVGVIAAATALIAMLLFSIVSAAIGTGGLSFALLSLVVVSGGISVSLAVQALRQVNRDPEESGVVWAVVGLVVGVSLIVVSGLLFVVPSLIGLVIGIFLARKWVPFGDRSQASAH